MMNSERHIASVFDRDLESVQAMIMKMGGMVEAALLDAATALDTRDDELSDRVRQGDKVHVDRGMEFGAATALIELPISWSTDDFPHFEYLRLPTTVNPGLMNARLVLQNWLDDWDYMIREEEWGILTYTLATLTIRTT